MAKERPNKRETTGTENSRDMHPEIAAAVIRAVPTLFAVVVAAICIFVFRREIRLALPRVVAVEAFGLKFTMNELEAWKKAASAVHTQGEPFTTEELRKALDRASASSAAFTRARILWVDDTPENVIWERRAFRALGAAIDVVTSNREATESFRRNEYDLIISDLNRPSEDPRSFTTNPSPVEWAYEPRVIYYTSTMRELRDVPEAFGITTAPDELVHLVTDALERRTVE